MRARTLALATALLATSAGAATTNADRLREVEGARAQAERQATLYADRARLIEDAALKAEARAGALTAQIAEAEARADAASLRAGAARARLATLRDDLAVGQRPLSRLMAALQRLARRPTILLVMRPSSIRDFVRLRAMVAGMQPQIAARTADLRSDLAEMRRLSAQAGRAAAEGRQARSDLDKRRAELAQMSETGRVTARELVAKAGRAQGQAALRGAEAASIGRLVAEERVGARTLAALAALPAPSLLAGQGRAPKASGALVPVRGRLLAGFGERNALGGRSTGLTIAPSPGEPVIAPLAGTVAFAAPYRGYGTIVILRHPGGRTSLLAGLATATVAEGETVRRGQLVGLAPRRDPAVLFEMRRGRRPVHPFES